MGDLCILSLDGVVAYRGGAEPAAAGGEQWRFDYVSDGALVLQLCDMRVGFLRFGWHGKMPSVAGCAHVRDLRNRIHSLITPPDADVAGLADVFGGMGVAPGAGTPLHQLRLRL